MPDPLDAPNYGDDGSLLNPDAARSRPDGSELDPTGITPIMEIMATAFQIMTAARVTGFSKSQSFTLAHDWFIAMHKASLERDE